MTAPRLTGQTPNNDIYLVDGPGGIPKYVQVIGLWTGMPATLLAGCRARRAATLTGVCPFCDYQTLRHHHHDCNADFDYLQRSLALWEHIRTTYTHKPRGERITEDPTDPTLITTFDRLQAIGIR